MQQEEIIMRNNYLETLEMTNIEIKNSKAD